MIRNSREYSRGAMNGQLVTIFGLLAFVVILSGLSVWLYTMYDDQKTNVDSKVSLAVAAAKKEQADADEIKIKKVEEEPNREFAGPEDYGRVSFKYPKNWSVYIANDVTVSGGRYLAFLNPVVVPPVSGSGLQQYALRVSIEQVAYDKELGSYRSLIEKGDLKSQPISVNGHDGTRLDGSFNKNIRGAAVLFKVRDKTLTIHTDADTFKPYFEDIIKTIDFND